MTFCLKKVFEVRKKTQGKTLLDDLAFLKYFEKHLPKGFFSLGLQIPKKLLNPLKTPQKPYLLRLNTPKTSQNTSKTSQNTSKTSQNTSKTSQNTSKTSQNTSKTSQNTSKTSQNTSKTSQNTSKTSQNTSKTSQNTSKTSQNTSKTSQNTSKTSQNTSKTSQNTSKTSQNTSKTLGFERRPQPKCPNDVRGPGAARRSRGDLSLQGVATRGLVGGMSFFFFGLLLIALC